MMFQAILCLQAKWETRISSLSLALAPTTKGIWSVNQQMEQDY